MLNYLKHVLGFQSSQENKMLPLAGMLFNVVSGLVVDKASTLAKEHVSKMLDDVLDDDAKKELDKIIEEDPNHEHASVDAMLQAAADKVLPIPMKDGKMLPIELDLKITFDPNTRQVDIVQE